VVPGADLFELLSPPSGIRTFSIANWNSIPGLTRQQPSIRATVPKSAFRQIPSRRAYSTELAQALVEASRNIGMGSAAIGLAGMCQSLQPPVSIANFFKGAGAGIGVVFGALILGLARNPSLKNQMFQYAILGFAFAEATGLFALMISFLAKFV